MARATRTRTNTSSLAIAVSDANDIEEDLQKDMSFNCPFAKPVPKRVVYQSWQEAIMANVDGGVGPVFIGRRGDLDVLLSTS